MSVSATALGPVGQSPPPRVAPPRRGRGQQGASPVSEVGMWKARSTTAQHAMDEKAQALNDFRQRTLEPARVDYTHAVEQTRSTRGILQQLRTLVEGSLPALGVGTTGAMLTMLERANEGLETLRESCGVVATARDKELGLVQDVLKAATDVGNCLRNRAEAGELEFRKLTLGAERQDAILSKARTYVKVCIAERLAWQQEHGGNPAKLPTMTSTFVERCQQTLHLLKDAHTEHHLPSVSTLEPATDAARRFEHRANDQLNTGSVLLRYVPPAEELKLLDDALKSSGSDVALHKELADRERRFDKAKDDVYVQCATALSSIATMKSGLASMREMLLGLRRDGGIVDQLSARIVNAVSTAATASGTGTMLYTQPSSMMGMASSGSMASLSDGSVVLSSEKSLVGGGAMRRRDTATMVGSGSRKSISSHPLTVDPSAPTPRGAQSRMSRIMSTSIQAVVALSAASPKRSQSIVGFRKPQQQAGSPSSTTSPMQPHLGSALSSSSLLADSIGGGQSSGASLLCGGGGSLSSRGAGGTVPTSPMTGSLLTTPKASPHVSPSAAAGVQATTVGRRQSGRRSVSPAALPTHCDQQQQPKPHQSALPSSGQDGDGSASLVYNSHRFSTAHLPQQQGNAMHGGGSGPEAMPSWQPAGAGAAAASTEGGGDDEAVLPSPTSDDAMTRQASSVAFHEPRDERISSLFVVTPLRVTSSGVLQRTVPERGGGGSGASNMAGLATAAPSFGSGGGGGNPLPSMELESMMSASERNRFVAEVAGGQPDLADGAGGPSSSSAATARTTSGVVLTSGAGSSSSIRSTSRSDCASEGILSTTTSLQQQQQLLPRRGVGSSVSFGTDEVDVPGRGGVEGQHPPSGSAPPPPPTTTTVSIDVLPMIVAPPRPPLAVPTTNMVFNGSGMAPTHPARRPSSQQQQRQQPQRRSSSVATGGVHSGSGRSTRAPSWDPDRPEEASDDDDSTARRRSVPRNVPQTIELVMDTMDHPTYDVDLGRHNIARHLRRQSEIHHKVEDALRRASALEANSQAIRATIRAQQGQVAVQDAEDALIAKHADFSQRVPRDRVASAGLGTSKNKDHAMMLLARSNGTPVNGLRSPTTSLQSKIVKESTRVTSADRASLRVLLPTSGLDGDDTAAPGAWRHEHLSPTGPPSSGTHVRRSLR